MGCQKDMPLRMEKGLENQALYHSPIDYIKQEPLMAMPVSSEP